MKLSPSEIQSFQREVSNYFAVHRRDMPWRDDTRPYYVVVSELMLQQTQVDRVRPKFQAFITEFPSFDALAHAPLGKVLEQWVGLGYNRRAKFLHNLAKQVVAKYNGKLPDNIEALCALPGIGPNTAGAIMAYAFNKPTVFLETNIRSVLLHHFFEGKMEVSDGELRETAAAVLPPDNPREWYWALMDYGTYLKKTHGNNISRTKAYRKQSAFHGSLRQVRGQIIRALTIQPLCPDELAQQIPDARLPEALAALLAEKLITADDNRVQLAE